MRYAYSLQLQEESKIYPVFSYIIQIRPNYPQDIANIEYIAIGDPNLSIYLPFYWGLPDIPEEYRIIPDNKIDFSSILWRYWKLQFLVRQNYTKYAPLVQAQFISFEQEMNAKQVEVEKAYLKIYEIAPQQADSLLEEFTLIIINQADMVLDKLTKQLAHDLQMEKLNDNDYLAKMNESAS